MPTALPTTTPTEIPTTSPFVRWRKPIAEMCGDKKKADKFDVCIEWYSISGIPSGAPSTASNISSVAPSIQTSPAITSSIAPTDVQSRNEYIPDIPTSVPIKNLYDNEELTDIGDRVLIELDYFDMSITIVSTKKQLRSNDAIVQYRQGGDLTRQYEYEAAMHHLHEVYTSSFLNPLMSLNLTFIDVGETNTSASSVRDSIFYGSAEFETIDGHQDPTKSEVDKVTFLAFADHGKSEFLDEFQKYYEADSKENFAYDVSVHLLDHGSHLDAAHEDIQDAHAILPIVAGIAAVLVISVVAGLAYYTQRKKNRKQKQSDVAKPSSPIRQILHKSRIYGEFESDDDEMIDFEGTNIADAYMDSASIRSASPDTFAKNLQFHIHNESTDLRQFGMDVEKISVPNI